MDLEQIAAWMTAVTPVRTEAALCVRARSGRAACKACVEVCPAQAVTLEKGPAVDTDACTACGLCVAACPTGALRMDAPSDSALLASARALSGEPLICACPAEAAELSGRYGGQVLPVPCIGALSFELLAALLASGHQRVVLWRSERCDACPNGAGSDRLAAAAVAAVNELSPGRVEIGAVAAVAAAASVAAPAAGTAAGAAGAPASTAGGGRKAGAGVDQELVARDRRAFLGSMVKEGAGGLLGLLVGDWFRKPAPAQPAKPSLHDTTGLNRRRELLQRALPALSAPVMATLPERAVQVTPACSFCSVCSKLCPAGALRETVADGHAKLTWQASACTGCGLCQATCPARAIKEGERVSVGRFLAAEPEVLVTGTQATCACGAKYWQVLGGPVQCMACRMRSGRPSKAP